MLVSNDDDEEEMAKAVLLGVYVAGSGVCMGSDYDPSGYYHKKGQ